ncbi:hypothetical protein [Anabaena cylindrica]|uniref:hypothetical protein n=1 Tax=Anabaena cylindrica TaxID=1165 RepID=UPI002B1FE4B0|nr:hypothetical protein [Anabaena cylindrica]
MLPPVTVVDGEIALHSGIKFSALPDKNLRMRSLEGIGSCVGFAYRPQIVDIFAGTST